MDPLAIVTGLILLGGAVVFVLRPFRLKGHTTGKDEARLHPAEAHAAALSALRDLDFDYRTGKVSEEDYSGLRAQLVTEAAKCMSATTDEDDRLEAMIRARKSIVTSERACPKCGRGVTADAHFCPHCGAELGLVCPSCGKPVHEGDFFCRSCGSKLEVRAEATA